MSNRETVLIIDDEVQIRRLLHLTLETEGYRVVEAASASEGMDLFTSKHPDLVLLDLGLPDHPGQEILKQIRGLSSVPIIILSAQDRDQEKIEALDAGADDYLTKPFSSPELKARMRVALRHKKEREFSVPTLLSFGRFHFDREGKTLKRDNEFIHLTDIEFRLLGLLLENRGRVLTHTHILRSVWGPRQEDELQYLRIYIANLRKKMEDDPANPKLICTETGIGYRFVHEPS